MQTIVVLSLLLACFNAQILQQHEWDDFVAHKGCDHDAKEYHCQSSDSCVTDETVADYVGFVHGGDDELCPKCTFEQVREDGPDCGWNTVDKLGQREGARKGQNNREDCLRQCNLDPDCKVASYHEKQKACHMYRQCTVEARNTIRWDVYEKVCPQVERPAGEDDKTDEESTEERPEDNKDDDTTPERPEDDKEDDSTPEGPQDGEDDKPERPEDNQDDDTTPEGPEDGQDDKPERPEDNQDDSMPEDGQDDKPEDDKDDESTRGSDDRAEEESTRGSDDKTDEESERGSDDRTDDMDMMMSCDGKEDLCLSYYSYQDMNCREMNMAESFEAPVMLDMCQELDTMMMEQHGEEGAMSEMMERASSKMMSCYMPGVLELVEFTNSGCTGRGQSTLLRLDECTRDQGGALTVSWVGACLEEEPEEPKTESTRKPEEEEGSADVVPDDEGSDQGSDEGSDPDVPEPEGSDDDMCAMYEEMCAKECPVVPEEDPKAAPLKLREGVCVELEGLGNLRVDCNRERGTATVGVGRECRENVETVMTGGVLCNYATIAATVLCEEEMVVIEHCPDVTVTKLYQTSEDCNDVVQVESMGVELNECVEGMVHTCDEMEDGVVVARECGERRVEEGMGMEKRVAHGGLERLPNGMVVRTRVEGACRKYQKDEPEGSEEVVPEEPETPAQPCGENTDACVTITNYRGKCQDREVLGAETLSVVFGACERYEEGKFLRWTCMEGDLVAKKFSDARCTEETQDQMLLEYAVCAEDEENSYDAVWDGSCMPGDEGSAQGSEQGSAQGSEQGSAQGSDEGSAQGSAPGDMVVDLDTLPLCSGIPGQVECECGNLFRNWEVLSFSQVSVDKLPLNCSTGDSCLANDPEDDSKLMCFDFGSQTYNASPDVASENQGPSGQGPSGQQAPGQGGQQAPGQGGQAPGQGAPGQGGLGRRMLQVLPEAQEQQEVVAEAQEQAEPGHADRTPGFDIHPFCEQIVMTCGPNPQQEDVYTTTPPCTDEEYRNEADDCVRCDSHVCARGMSPVCENETVTCVENTSTTKDSVIELKPTSLPTTQPPTPPPTTKDQCFTPNTTLPGTRNCKWNGRTRDGELENTTLEACLDMCYASSTCNHAAFHELQGKCRTFKECPGQGDRNSVRWTVFDNLC